MEPSRRPALQGYSRHGWSSGRFRGINRLGRSTQDLAPGKGDDPDSRSREIGASRICIPQRKGEGACFIADSSSARPENRRISRGTRFYKEVTNSTLHDDNRSAALYYVEYVDGKG